LATDLKKTDKKKTFLRRNSDIFCERIYSTRIYTYKQVVNILLDSKMDQIKIHLYIAEEQNIIHLYIAEEQNMSESLFDPFCSPEIHSLLS